MQDAEFDRFIDEISSSGIDYFSIGLIKKDTVSVLFSCAAWQTFYLESQCFDFDPLVQMALAKVNRPIDWNSVSIIQKKHSVIMDTRQKLTGCQEGFTVVKEIDNGTSALLAFGTRGAFFDVVASYLLHEAQIMKLVESLNTKH
jgi:hypothetical protein